MNALNRMYTFCAAIFMVAEFSTTTDLMAQNGNGIISGNANNKNRQLGKPNILFIAIDDMNDWTTLFNKDNPIKTPNLERLAARGTFFTHAYCAVAACNPSRTAILTGLNPTTSGVYGNGQEWKKLLPDVVTLPQYFKQYDYAIGKKMAETEHFIWENTTLPPENRPGSLKKMVQCYQASADFADEMVGRLIDKLDATGRTENTIIVLWGDNGYHLGDKGACVKFTLWEKANRIPFIIVAPGITKPGSRCDKPVSLVDIYPTLIELANLPSKKDLDGLSLVPLLKNPDIQWTRPAIMTMGPGNHAVRSERWRYIRYSDGAEELYDHQNDPWEWTNLAANQKYADVIAEHKKWLPIYEKPFSQSSGKKVK